MTEDAPGTPRWVKAFGVVAVIVVVLFAVLLFVGGGHGPSRHVSPEHAAST